MRKIVQQVTAGSPPIAVSMVDKPAVRKPFKVIRSEDNDAARTSSSHDNITAISFPVGTSDEVIDKTLSSLNLSGTVSRQESTDTESILYAKAKQEGISNVTTVTMRNESTDFTLHLAMSPPISRSDSSITGVTLYSITFPEDKKVEEVEQWLSNKGINYLVERSETANGVHNVVLRPELPANVELKPITIEEGVIGYVHRSEDDYIPESVAMDVIEEAYGNYGWGILDFNQYMANEEFRDGFYDAVWGFRNVMENILIDSELSVDERTTMAQNALKSFSTYLMAMLAALPKTGAQLVMTSEDSTRGQKDMALTNKQTPTTVAQSTAPAGVGTQEVQREESQHTPAVLTRAELTEAMTAAVASLQQGIIAAFTSSIDSLVKRSDDKLTETAKELTGQIGSVSTAIQDLGSTVVLRQEANNTKPARAPDPFDGALFGPRQ